MASDDEKDTKSPLPEQPKEEVDILFPLNYII